MSNFTNCCSKEGSVSFSKRDSDQPWVVVEVAHEGHSTLVRVRSTVVLRNCCMVPLDCLLYSPRLAREEVVSLPAESTLHVPLALAAEILQHGCAALLRSSR